MADESAPLCRPAVNPVIKFSVFVGIYMARCFDSITWLWANLSIYVISYYYVKGDNTSAENTSWLVSVYSTGYNLGILIGEVFIRRFGILKTLFVVTFIFNGSILLSYFALDQSAILLTVTFGAIPGLSGGISESCRFKLIVNWTNKYYGLATSSILSSLMLGSLFTNLFMTTIINPSNEETNSIIHSVPIFTQKDIVDRVPKAILLYGIICTAVHFTGFFLVREQPGDDSVFRQLVRWLKHNTCGGERVGLVSNEQNSRYINDNSEKISSFSSNISTSKEQVENYGSDVNSDYDDRVLISAPIYCSDITPRDVLKRRDFYTLLICTTCQYYGIFVINTYYKSFGLLRIGDDHFLTYIVMVRVVVGPLIAWIAGFCSDKIGVKFTLIFFSSIYTFVTSLFFLTSVDKWLYLFSCVAFDSSLISLFCVTSSCCVRLFGTTHFTSIFGMTLSSTYILTFVQPPLSQWIISTSGYFPIFYSASCLGFIHVLMCIWGLPESAPKPLSITHK